MSVRACLFCKQDELSELIMFAINKEPTSMAEPAARPQVRVEINLTQSPAVRRSHQLLLQRSPLPRHRPWRTRKDSKAIPQDRAVRKQWQKGHCPLPWCEDSHAHSNPSAAPKGLSHELIERCRNAPQASGSKEELSQSAEGGRAA